MRDGRVVMFRRPAVLFVGGGVVSEKWRYLCLEALEVEWRGGTAVP